MRTVKIAAAIVACAIQAYGAATVTASRDYVDRKTTLHPSSNGVEQVGYFLGTQTNKVLASKEYVDNSISASSPGDYLNVSNKAYAAYEVTSRAPWLPATYTEGYYSVTGNVRFSDSEMLGVEFYDGIDVYNHFNIYGGVAGWVSHGATFNFEDPSSLTFGGTNITQLVDIRASNYTDNAIIILAETNSVLSGGPYLKTSHSNELETVTVGYEAGPGGLSFAPSKIYVGGGAYFEDLIVVSSETNGPMSGIGQYGGEYKNARQEMEDYVTNAMSRISSDLITDGTNMISASGHVYKIMDDVWVGGPVALNSRFYYGIENVFTNNGNMVWTSIGKDPFQPEHPLGYISYSEGTWTYYTFDMGSYETQSGGPDLKNIDNGRFTRGSYNVFIGKLAMINDIPRAAVETNESGNVEANITFRKVNEDGIPVDTEVTIGGADAFDTHNKILVEGSYNGGEVYVSGRYGEGGVRILGGGSEANPDEGGKIIIDGTNIVPVVFGAAQSIDTNYNDSAFVKDDGTIYYKVMKGVWSTVNGTGYMAGARLYVYSYGATTNWTWYVAGGTQSSYRTIEAPLDATELTFRYSAAITNNFYRGSHVARLGMVGKMIETNVVSLVTNIHADVRVEGSFSQGTNTTASGAYSHAEGDRTLASGKASHAEGVATRATGEASHASGVNVYATQRATFGAGVSVTGTNSASFIWSGSETSPWYGTHGKGTFNVNPIGGASGFFIGNENLIQVINASLMSDEPHTVTIEYDEGQPVTTNYPALRAAVEQIVLDTIRENSLSGIYDSHLQTWWTPAMVNGSYKFMATTNVDMNAESDN